MINILVMTLSNMLMICQYRFNPLTYTIIMVRSNMILGLKLLLKIYMRVQEKLSVLLCFMMEFLLL